MWYLTYYFMSLNISHKHGFYGSLILFHIDGYITLILPSLNIALYLYLYLYISIKHSHSPIFTHLGCLQITPPCFFGMCVLNFVHFQIISTNS